MRTKTINDTCVRVESVSEKDVEILSDLRCVLESLKIPYNQEFIVSEREAVKIKLGFDTTYLTTLIKNLLKKGIIQEDDLK